MKIAFSGCRDHETSMARSILSVMMKLLKVNNQVYRDILVGDCPTGIDKSVREAYGIEIDALNCYRADWDEHKLAAGPIRNKTMIADADALIAFWDGKSKGTKNCIKCATNKRIPVLIMPVD